MKKIFERIKSIFIMWSWTIAIRINNDDKTCILENKDDEFIIVPNSKRYWCADPFLFEKNGKIYLFFEAFDILKRKGLLGYRTVDGNNFGDINIIFEYPTHLSFPFIYEKDDECYIIPESGKSEELFMLICEKFPDKWNFDRKLLDKHLVDTIRFVKDGKEYLITELVNENGVYDRVDLYCIDDNTVFECTQNPVKTDASNARGAGAIFDYKGKLIRPTQDCSESYGEKLNFNEVIRFETEGYEEKLIETISYQDVNINRNLKIDGIHTYNKLKNYEVIDLRIPGKFNLLYTIGFFRKLIKRILGD